MHVRAMKELTSWRTTNSRTRNANSAKRSRAKNGAMTIGVKTRTWNVPTKNAVTAKIKKTRDKSRGTLLRCQNGAAKAAPFLFAR